MKAMVLEENKKLVYTDVPSPENEWENGVLIRIAASGICNSDMHRGYGGGAYHYPLIMGHEFSGIIEDASLSEKFRKGDRVTVFPLLPCKVCLPCRSGDYAQCTDYDYFGSRRHGAFTEYIWAPEENLFKIPDYTDIVHASMTEPAAVALHGARRFSVKPGSSGAVFGGGPIGNMVAQWLRISGCRDVFVVDLEKPKLEIAENMGFNPVDPSKGDPVEQIIERTGGGSDCTVEAVGLPLTFLQAVQSTARFGQVVFLGNIRGEFRVGEKDFSNILRKEITIRGTWNSKITPRGKDDWTTALSYMGRGLDVAPLISHTPGLEEGPDIFHKLVNKEGFFNKIIFVNER